MSGSGFNRTFPLLPLEGCTYPAREARSGRFLLAVHVDELGFRIAFARRGIGRKRLCQFGQMPRRQLDVERAERFRQAIATPRADQWHDIVALRRDPSDRNLCWRRSDVVGNLP